MPKDKENVDQHQHRGMLVGVVWSCADVKLLLTSLLLICCFATVLQFLPTRASFPSASLLRSCLTSKPTELLTNFTLTPVVVSSSSSESLSDDGIVIKRSFNPIGTAAYLFIQMSAYRGGANSFAVVGLGSKPIHVFAKPRFHCEWMSNNNNTSIHGDASKILPDWGYGRVYTVVIINCTFPAAVGADDAGGRLVLTATSGGGGDRAIETEERILALDEPPSTFNATVYTSAPQYDYLYCGSPLYGNLSPQRVREWIAYHARLFGPRAHFVIYDAGGVHAGVLEVLRPWIEMGVVTLQDIREQERFDGYYHNQFLVVNDCLHRYRFATKWMFFPQFQISESSSIGHQSMEPRSLFLAALLAAVFLTATAALFPSDALNSAAPKAIADLREAIVKGLGTQAEGVSLTGFDVQDALVGQALSYEFSIEVNNEEIPVRLLEDVSRWDFVDLPIFRSEMEGEGKVLAKPGMRTDGVVPVLAPFQLAGPMELWIQDGDDMRLALPHDVDAGKLKKVILSDGAVVTVKGARSVSLRHPLELPLPLNRTNHQSNPFASGLLTIADALRQSSRNDEIPLLSLRIVGPTSITSTPSESVSDKLKLKLLAPGLVQLSSRSIPSVTEDVGESMSTLWPLTSLNGSDATLMGIEELLASVLRKKGSSEGSFRLVKADVSARTYVKMGFVVEKKLLGEELELFNFPEWKTKPEKVRGHYEVLARVEENGKVIPERIAEVHPFQVQESFEESLLTGNVSMSHVPIVHPPPTYFTL